MGKLTPPSDIPLYQYPQEKWTKAKCEKVRKAKFKDGLGTPGPYRGLVEPSGRAVPYYGAYRYNGGYVEDKKWYPGFVRPYPKLPKGWKFINICSWGTFLAREKETDEDLLVL